MKQKKRRLVPDAGESAGARNAEIEELMTRSVMTVTRHQSVGRVRELMREHGVHSLPVVDAEGQPVGIVTPTDLLGPCSDEARIAQVMTKKVYTIPRYSGVHLAARMMRNHGIHHLVVTHEQRVVGVLSSFDLLRLIEDRRFVPKNSPSTPRRSAGQRKKREEPRDV